MAKRARTKNNSKKSSRGRKVHKKSPVKIKKLAKTAKTPQKREVNKKSHQTLKQLIQSPVKTRIPVLSRAARVVSIEEKKKDSATPVCREVACELIATTLGYCRLHYIKNWKKLKRKELILKEKKLNRYIEELVSKYPDKYIEAIRLDLASEKDFATVIADLEIEEGLDDFDVETESAEGIIDNIKRDAEDDSDIF